MQKRWRVTLSSWLVHSKNQKDKEGEVEVVPEVAVGGGVGKYNKKIIIIIIALR